MALQHAEERVQYLESMNAEDKTNSQVTWLEEEVSQLKSSLESERASTQSERDEKVKALKLLRESQNQTLEQIQLLNLYKQ